MDNTATSNTTPSNEPMDSTDMIEYSYTMRTLSTIGNDDYENFDIHQLHLNYSENYDNISNELKALNDKAIISIIKANELERKIYIEINYLGNTKYNPTESTITFLIEINDHFPHSSPKLTCQSSFIFPSLFDNRNLIKAASLPSISNYIRRSSLRSLITNDIPTNIIHSYMNDIYNKIYAFIGEYKLSKLYLVNDFMVNPKNSFYKGIVNNVFNYIIVTDVAILFFVPYEKCLEKGKLLYVIEMKDIKTIAIVEDKEGKVMIEVNLMEYSEERKRKVMRNKMIVLKKEAYDKFHKKVEERRKKIGDWFKLYQKYHSGVKRYDNGIEEGKEAIEKMINYKEGLLEEILNKEKIEEKDKDNDHIEGGYEYKHKLSYKYENEEHKQKTHRISLIKDLIVLYQKAIEIYSDQSNTKYSMYMNKLRDFIMIHHYN